MDECPLTSRYHHELHINETKTKTFRREEAGLPCGKSAARSCCDNNYQMIHERYIAEH